MELISRLWQTGSFQGGAEEQTGYGGHAPPSGLAEDEDAIEVDKVKALEQVIDQALEDSRAIVEAKGHYKVLIMPHGSVESCLWLVPLSNANQW